MNTESRSDVLSTSTVRKVFPACMVYALVQSMTFMVDTVLAGHFLGDDAVAAVAMGLPIIGLMISFTAMILHGGYHKLIHCMGKSDMEGYNRIYSIALTFTIVVDVIFIAICLFATDFVVGISGGAKATATAAAYGDLYVKTACLMIIFFAVGSLFQLVSATYGYQTDRMISSIVNVALNIVISIAAIQLLDEPHKVVGLGIGSAAGALGQMIVALVFMKKKNISVKFKFYPINKKNIMDCLDCMRRGLPSSVDNLMDSASGSVVNNIILSVFANGTSVLALVSMIKTIYTLVKTIGRGSLYAGEPLMGILDSERDTDGVISTFKATVKYGVIYAAILAVVIIAVQQPILNFYNLSGSTDARLGVILVAIGCIVTVFPFVFDALYETTGHLTLSLLVSVVPDSILYPIFIATLGGVIGVTGIWLGMAFSFIPFFIVYYLVFMVIHKRLAVPLDRLLVLKRYEDRDTALDVSIPATATKVSFVSESLQKFFTEQKVDPRIAYQSALCMEEIAADYIEYRQKSGLPEDKAYMDIKAFRDEDRIELILRNYDEPYDPLIIEKDGVADETFSKIGIIMTQKIADKVLYSYAYHLNIVTVSIPVVSAN